MGGIDGFVKDIQSITNAIDGYIKEQRALNDQLERLMEARKQIAAQQQDFRTIRKSCRQIAEDHYEWIGRTRETFYKKNVNPLLTSYDHADKRMTDMLDQLSLEIAELKKKINWVLSLIESARKALKTLNSTP